MNTPSKDTIMILLQDWIKHKPGLDFRDYGNRTSYFSEMRRITKQKSDAEILLRSVEYSNVTADDLMDAFQHAYSGRLQVKENDKGFYLDYCTGQYFPTEYRAAACAVLASALWSYHRTDFKAVDNAGDELRKRFRRMFGRGIQSRWFN